MAASTHVFITIAQEAAWTFAILVLLLAAGLGPMLLFRERVRFPVLAAPFAGLLLVNCAALAIYFIFVTTFPMALLGATAIVVAASVTIVASLRLRPNLRKAGGALAAIALASTCACLSSEQATIRNGSISLTFLDGWDTLSYAHVADWIKDHRSRPEVHAPPGTPLLHADPAIPYESLPQLLLGNEPRTGAFGYLAALATARAVPSAFAYDWACAVLLASAILGVAAVFAGTKPALAVLVLALAVSHWYDYTQAGFLAKSLAYPSILFLAGLILKTRGQSELPILALLCAFSAASALLLTGLLTAAALVALCAPVELIAYGAERRVPWPDMSRLAICALVAIAASGYFQHPVSGWDRQAFPAASVGSRSLDLEGWFALVGVSELTLTLMIVAALGSAFALGRVALLSDRRGPAGLLLGPIAIYGLLLILHLRSESMQTTGLLYPATMCGAAWLISEPIALSRSAPLWVIAAIIAAAIGLRIPRAVTALVHYTGRDAFEASYSKTELDGLAAVIGKHTALIAMGNRAARECVLMSVELGRRGLALQWTAESWYWPIRSWRPDWTVPHYSTRPDVIVIRADDIGTAKPLYLGSHFALITADSPSAAFE